MRVAVSSPRHPGDVLTGTALPVEQERAATSQGSLPFPPAALAPGGRTGKVDGRGPKESASRWPQAADALQPRRRACLRPQ